MFTSDPPALALALLACVARSAVAPRDTINRSNASKQNLLETNDPIWRLLKIANSFRKLVDMYVLD